jgi:hypothetical protein
MFLTEPRDARFQICVEHGCLIPSVSLLCFARPECENPWKPVSKARRNDVKKSQNGLKNREAVLVKQIIDFGATAV